MGAYLAARDPGDSAARRLDLRRAVCDPELQRRVHGRLHEHDADRRLPRRRPPGGDVRHRAHDGRARRQARDRPARAAPQELHQGVPGDDRARVSRSTPATTHASLDRLLEKLDLDALHAEQEKRRDNGDVKQLGVGFSTYNEMCGLAPSRILGAIRYAAGGWETGDHPAACRPDPSRSSPAPRRTARVTRRRGRRSSPTSSGCEMDAHRGAPRRHLRLARGLDTYGSRSLPVGGVALWQRGREGDREGARDRRAPARGRRGDDLEYDERHVQRQGLARQGDDDRGAAWTAFAAHNLPDGMEPGLEATATYDPPNFSWPGGAHAAVVEVDTETGDARLVRYVAIDDVGTVVNPLIVEGQIHGGITQGIATALYEEGIVRRGGQPPDGEPRHLPRAVGGRAAVVRARPDATTSPTNPLGVKGVGETGTIAVGPGRDQRGRSTRSRTSASRTSRCRPRPSVSGARSRRRSRDPRSVRLRGRRERRPRDRAARQPTARREAARRRPFADPGDEAPDRPPDEARRHRPARRPRVRPRCAARTSRSGRSRARGRRAATLLARSTARSSRSPPGRSAIRRFGTAGRSAGRSPTAIPPPTCRR